MTAQPRPWDDMPLDVDGVLSLDQHRQACIEPMGCPFCMGLDDQPLDRRRKRVRE